MRSSTGVFSLRPLSALSCASRSAQLSPFVVALTLCAPRDVSEEDRDGLVSLDGAGVTRGLRLASYCFNRCPHVGKKVLLVAGGLVMAACCGDDTVRRSTPNPAEKLPNRVFCWIIEILSSPVVVVVELCALSDGSASFHGLLDKASDVGANPPYWFSYRLTPSPEA